MKNLRSCTEKNAKRAALYREAAYRQETGDELGICLTVANITGEAWKSGPNTAPIHQFFKPRGNDGSAFWEFDRRGNDCRVVALCFLAAMAERGDL